MAIARTFLPLILTLGTLPRAAEDWPRFRGPNGSGTSSSTGLPVEFGPDKNKLWEVDVPFGRSSPVIAGDRIFVSAVEDGELLTLALDRKSGKTVWRTALEPNRVDEFHHDTDSATTTPVTDGSNVYVFFQELAGDWSSGRSAISTASPHRRCSPATRCSCCAIRWRGRSSWR